MRGKKDEKKSRVCRYFLFVLAARDSPLCNCVAYVSEIAIDLQNRPTRSMSVRCNCLAPSTLPSPPPTITRRTYFVNCFIKLGRAEIFADRNVIVGMEVIYRDTRRYNSIDCSCHYIFAHGYLHGLILGINLYLSHLILAQVTETVSFLYGLNLHTLVKFLRCH